MAILKSRPSFGRYFVLLFALVMFGGIGWYFLLPRLDGQFEMGQTTLLALIFLIISVYLVFSLLFTSSFQITKDAIKVSQLFGLINKSYPLASFNGHVELEHHHNNRVSHTFILIGGVKKIRIKSGAISNYQEIKSALVQAIPYNAEAAAGVHAKRNLTFGAIMLFMALVFGYLSFQTYAHFSAIVDVNELTEVSGTIQGIEFENGEEKMAARFMLSEFPDTWFVITEDATTILNEKRVFEKVKTNDEIKLYTLNSMADETTSDLTGILGSMYSMNGPEVCRIIFEDKEILSLHEYIPARQAGAIQQPFVLITGGIAFVLILIALFSLIKSIRS